jgi:hypothetical protein
MRRTTSLSIPTPNANEICWAIRGQSPAGIPLLRSDDGVDKFLVRAPGARSTRSRTRKQHPVLAFLQNIVQVQQGRGSQADGNAEEARRSHEQGAQAGDNPIRGTQVGCTLAATVEDQ